MDDPRVAQLEQWMRQDNSIKILMRNMLRAYDEDTLTLLLQNRPGDFEDVYGSVAAMVEDIPPEDIERGQW